MQSKKYQIFVSSTKEDLGAERQAVYEAILDLGHIPAGMEWFPSSDLSQWDYIEKQLATTDYVVLISAGKYGSIVPGESISWTEKEFDYCHSQGIPVLSFLIEDIDALPGNRIDSGHRAGLEAFRKKLSNGRLMKTYNTPSDLKSKVIAALSQSFNDNPRVGWIRADEVDQMVASSADLGEMKKQIEELTKRTTFNII